MSVLSNWQPLKQKLGILVEKNALYSITSFAIVHIDQSIAEEVTDII